MNRARSVRGAPIGGWSPWLLQAEEPFAQRDAGSHFVPVDAGDAGDSTEAQSLAP